LYEEEISLNREFHGTPLAKLKDDLISMMIIAFFLALKIKLLRATL